MLAQSEMIVVFMLDEIISQGNQSVNGRSLFLNLYRYEIKP